MHHRRRVPHPHARTRLVHANRTDQHTLLPSRACATPADQVQAPAASDTQAKLRAQSELRCQTVLKIRVFTKDACCRTGLVPARMTKGRLAGCTAGPVKPVVRRHPNPLTMNLPSSAPSAQDVLDFWFGDGLQRDWPSDDRQALWFGGGAAQDETIRQRFGALVASALGGGLTEWESNLPTRLALLIVLDQFSRNVHRGQASAFAGDARAQRLTLTTLAAGEDDQLARVGHVFLCMPLMHAEDLALQERCVACFTALHDNSPLALRKELAGNLHFAQEHRDTIQRFGRFPHRNAALGRASSTEEKAFLKGGPRYGQ